MNLIPALDAETAQKPAAFPRMIVPAAAFGIVLGLAGIGECLAGGGGAMAYCADRQPLHLDTRYRHMGVAVDCLWLQVDLSARESAAGDRAPHSMLFCRPHRRLHHADWRAVSPYFPAAAQLLFWLGALWTVVFAVWRTGVLWTVDASRRPRRRFFICRPSRALTSWRSSASR